MIPDLAPARPPERGELIAWTDVDGAEHATPIAWVWHRNGVATWRVSYVDPGLDDRDRGGTAYFDPHRGVWRPLQDRYDFYRSAAELAARHAPARPDAPMMEE